MTDKLIGLTLGFLLGVLIVMIIVEAFGVCR